MTSASEPPTSTAAPTTSTRWRWYLALGALLAVGVATRYLPFQSIIKDTLDSIGRLGGWGPALFIASYILATVLFIPGSALTLGAGAVFGFAWGCAYASAGSTLGALCAFWVGRHWARDAIARRLQGNSRFNAIDQAVAQDGWKIVLLTRLSPMFPFTLLNYAFGITRVSMREYALASWIGMMPGTVLYVYLGSLAHEATGERKRSLAEWILYAIGLAATLIVTVVITRRAKKALSERIRP
ncbi:MAG: TVP38/TMEM64 family protein [Verrucomicrobiales bacterium]|nr:TVP38/TMEM64 family protein [Verrucomicrobiales bacterium]